MVFVWRKAPHIVQYCNNKYNTIIQEYKTKTKTHSNIKTDTTETQLADSLQFYDTRHFIL